MTSSICARCGETQWSRVHLGSFGRPASEFIGRHEFYPLAEPVEPETRIPDDLYKLIVKSMPIPCVDLLVIDGSGRVLLVQRKNAPGSGLWWFPGGRILHGEKLVEVVHRKLMQECGLDSRQASVEVLGVAEILLDGTHSITVGNLVRFAPGVELNVKLDEQSSAFAWRSPSEWLPLVKHKFMTENLTMLTTRGYP